MIIEKQGKWSDILETIIPDVQCDVYLENLQNIWSIKVAFLLENRVGIVICGVEPFDTNKSKNSWNFSLSVSFKRFKLKSPPVTSVEFSLVNFLKMSENGTKKLSIDALELLSRGGR